MKVKSYSAGRFTKHAFGWLITTAVILLLFSSHVSAEDNLLYKDTVTVYHTHGEQSKSSCYNPVRCTGYGTSGQDYGSGDPSPGNACWSCNKCGHGGACDGTPWGTRVNCKRILSYNLLCQDDGKELGTIELSVSKDLLATVSVDCSGISDVTYLWSTGDTSNSIQISQLGTYDCVVSFKDDLSGLYQSVTLSYTLDDIESPVIQSVDVDLVRTREVQVNVTATDNISVDGFMLTR